MPGESSLGHRYSIKPKSLFIIKYLIQKLGERLIKSLNSSFWTILTICLALMAGGSGVAADNTNASSSAALPNMPATAHQEIVLGGDTLEYNVTAGLMPCYDVAGNLTARIFYLAYIKKGNDSRRPISFFFNGGPGFPSQMVNLIGFGPKTLPLGNDTLLQGPPYRLEDNPDTLLNITDLVFMDPVGTGFSEAVPRSENTKFWNVDGDIASMSEFVRVYLERNNRTDSPIFIGGESYGGLRAAGMASKLHKLGIYPSGVILISPAIDYPSSLQGDPADFSWSVTSLPVMTATAWYYKKTSPRLLNMTLDEVLQESRSWASGEYLQALWSGGDLKGPKRDEVIKRLIEYTGLDEGTIVNNNLKLNLTNTVIDLFKKDRQQLSWYDCRIKGPSNDDPLDDPLIVKTDPGIATTFNSLLQDLGYRTDKYYTKGFDNPEWKWGMRNEEGKYTFAGDDLAQAMRGRSPPKGNHNLRPLRSVSAL